MNFAAAGNTKCDAAQAKNSSQAINYIKKHAVTINSLTSLPSDNYKDLEPLKNVLKNKQVVYLGESFHCVGEYNSSKVRLIKYLHEKLGFNVLAFESDLGTCSTVSDTTQKLLPTEAMVNSILGVWNTKEMLPLFQYMKSEGNKKNKLNLTGFDMQPNCLIGDFFSVYTYKMLSKIDTTKAKNFYKFDISYLKNMMVLGNKYDGLSVPDKEISKIKKAMNTGIG
jgi:erythromycin esterase